MDSAIIRSDWVGQIVDGRFVLLEWLGGSPSGEVFLTDLLEGDRTQKAAIKLIAADGKDAEAQLTDWEMAKELDHPHLMPLFYAGRCEIGDVALLYVVTEYSEEILSQILEERPLTPAETREMLDQVLDVLAYLHGRGFVHGRLRPSNLLAVDDQLKLSSDSLHVAGKLGKHAAAIGVYDAPEVAEGNFSPAADMWSLGVTLFETLTGAAPDWDRANDRGPYLPETVPRPFSGIVRNCLRVAPADRCTISEIKAHLVPARPAMEFDPFPIGKAAAGKAPAKPRRKALVAAVLVVLAVFAIVELRSHRSGPSAPSATQQPEIASPTPTPQAPVQTQVPAPAPAPVPTAAAAPAPTSGTQSSNGATVKSSVAEKVLPDVLPSARESIRGQVNVKVEVTVDAGGSVSNATLDSPETSRYFAKVAMQAARQWRFKPAQVDGQPVASTWVLQFRFTQDGTEVSPIETAP